MPGYHYSFIPLLSKTIFSIDPYPCRIRDEKKVNNKSLINQ